MVPVIVLGCHVSGLAVIRTLGRRNIPVIAMSAESRDFAQVSKYVTEAIKIPHPEQEQEFVDFLVTQAHRWPGALILETNDFYTVVLARHKTLLQKYYKIVTPDLPVMQLFIEKQMTSKLADSAGVPYPQTFAPEGLDDLDGIVSQVKYPAILKPIHSHEFVKMFSTKNFKVENNDELLKKFKKCLDAKQPVILQEVIPGPDTEIYRLQTYVNSRGQMSAKFFHNKVRQNPPQFGEMRVGISTERNLEVERLSELLLQKAGFKGYGSIEFRKDPRDGLLKFIEMNIRMPRSGNLAISSGVDMPWIIYQDLVLDQQTITKEYRINNYWVEIHTDLINTLFRNKREDFTIKDYFRPYFAKHKGFAIWATDDLKPFLYRTWRILTKYNRVL